MNLKGKIVQLWAKYTALPWKAQILIGAGVGMVLGRLGFPWII